MANVDGPFGLRPVGTVSGGSYTGNMVTCVALSSYATDLFVGDTVVMTGTGVQAADGQVYAAVQKSTATGPVFGVIQGFEPNRDNLSIQYGAASTERRIRVVPATAALFEVQEDSVGGALAVTGIGAHYDLILGAGSTVTGRSGIELDSNTVDAVGTGVISVISLANRPDNEIGTNANWIVKIVNTQLGTAVPLGV